MMPGFKACLGGALRAAPLFFILCASCGPSKSLKVERILRCGGQPEGLALSKDGKELAVACSRSGELWIFNLAGGASRSVDTDALPSDAVFMDGRLLVCESGADTVAQVALAQGRVTRRFKVLPEPARLQEHPDGQRLLVTSLSLEGFGSFRGAALRPEKIVKMEGHVERLLPSPDGKEILAVTSGTSSFARIRASDLSAQVSLLVKGSPVDLAVSHEGDFAWVAAEGEFYAGEEEEREPDPGWLSEVRLSDSRVSEEAAICPGARALALGATGRFLYLLCGEESELQVYESKTLKWKESLALPGDPTAIALSKDGRQAYVAQRDLNQVAVISLGAWR